MTEDGTEQEELRSCTISVRRPADSRWSTAYPATVPKAPRTELLDPFVAIDFETADHDPASDAEACAQIMIAAHGG